MNLTSLNVINPRCFPFLSAVIMPITLHADTSFDSSSDDAYSANSGWISFRHDQPTPPEGVLFGEYHLAGYAYSGNIGWINFGNGSPTNGHTYSNGAGDIGVNHDGTGNLAGYAYSPNTGWINFGWAGSTDPNRPRVDLTNGDFSGYAYSGNIGWINLGTGSLTAQSMDCPDTDIDGISDDWEMEQFGNLTTANASSDTDKDGASDADEYGAATDPNNAGSFMKVISHSYNGTYTEVTIEFTTVAKRLYRIQHSTDLGDSDLWANSSLGTFVADGATTTKVVPFTGTGESKYFFRAVAIRPLSP